ncbi:MAG: DUF4831 family protein [Prolixibacteraceae bacterium]|nr:DUF4831 family protein [Prolixibacteraceae bacterium]
MRNTGILLIIFLLITCSTEVFGQKKKSDEESILLNQPQQFDGIVYALPRTTLVIEVKAQKTTFVPGPYAAYADKYLGIKQVKTVPEEKWQLISMDINTLTEPDPEAIYKSMNQAAAIALNSEGIIAGIMVPGQTSEPLLTGFHQLKQKATDLIYTDLSSDEFYELTVNPENGTEALVLKSTEQKAREAADYLIRLRKKRAYTILDPSDVVPEDGKGYEIFLKEAEKLENEYTRLFTGTLEQHSQHHRFIFVPEKKEVKNELLFRFSEEKGVLPKTDISGKPVMISLLSIPNTLKNIQAVSKTAQPDAGQSGVFYRVPVVAELNISDGLNTLYHGQLTLPQFGEVLPVPEHLLNGQYAVSYQIETGAIKEIKPLK